MKIIAVLILVMVLCSADSWKPVYTFYDHGQHTVIEKYENQYRSITSINGKEIVTLLKSEQSPLFTRLRSSEGEIYVIIDRPDYSKLFSAHTSVKLSHPDSSQYSEIAATTADKIPAVFIEKEIQNSSEQFFALVPLSGTRFEKIPLSVDTSKGDIRMNSSHERTPLKAVIDWDESGNAYGKLWLDTAEYTLNCPYFAQPVNNNFETEE